jgi:hypothetical protein
MSIPSTALRAIAILLLTLFVAQNVQATDDNHDPQFDSQPPRRTFVNQAFEYDANASDVDGDTLNYYFSLAPDDATIDPSTGVMRWTPGPEDIGSHPIKLVVEDGKYGRGIQYFDLWVVEDYCSIYPIVLPRARVDGLSPGDLIDKLPRGTGTGNFSWLTWTGANNAPTLARSLTPPGDSESYVDPDDTDDRLLNIDDWAQGAPGSMNAAAVRTALDVLKTMDIILPVRDAKRGQGSNLDYHVQRFASVRLLDYKLTGQGYLTFTYKGEASCYNGAPTALPQTLQTNEDTALPITLTGTDPDNDALAFTVLDAPLHGTLSGTAPDLTYTPAPGYVGADSFTFKVNDGQVDSPSARIDIEVLLVNSAPVIVSSPVTVATEAQPYQYDADATDPDNDTLAYSLDQTPDALAMDAASGVISGVVDPGLLQSVRAFNGQCYVLPEGAGWEDPDGTAIAPLFQRVRRAISSGSAYAAPQTRTWHTNNNCLGCHVQNQTLLGLQGSMQRADVDEETAEYLLAEILASQQADGSIRRSHPEYAGNQTAFALWALSYVPDQARTFNARERALRFFLPRIRVSGIQNYWSHDHASGWLRSPEAATALVALGINRYVQDASRLAIVTPEQAALAVELRSKLPGVAEYFLARSSTTTNNLTLALTMLGLAQTQAHVDDPALRARVDTQLALLDARLRERVLATGGWAYSVGGTADPLTSAWVGFALDTLDPPLTDPVVVGNIEYLLAAQTGSDGTWRTTSGLFSTHLATTGLVMAYLPVALEHLGNPDLSLGHMRLEQQADGRFLLSVEAINRGLADVNISSTLQFFTGRNGDGTLLGETAVAPLHSGETRWVSILLDAAPTTDVSATIGAANLDECLSNNNLTRAGLVVDRATDPHGLFDTQPYLLNLEDANAAPVITSVPVTAFEQGRPYTYQVTVADPDVGDAHEFELRQAPAGLFINPLNGMFGYDLSLLAPGTHTVTVRVTDLRGAFAEQTFQLVIAPNHPPEITSTPGTQVYLGDTYSYDTDATDADGDTLIYRLDGAPLTMSIDAASGVISWTPEARHLGDNPVAVLVDDGRGGTDRQTWVIKVEDRPVNRPPTITTTAPASVDERAVYAYDIDATDPDNDTLAYAIELEPGQSTIDVSSGLLSWTANTAFVESTREHNTACRAASGPGLFDPAVSWSWSGPQGLLEYAGVYGPTLVGQFTDDNGDGVVDARDQPDVVAMSGVQGHRYLNLIDAFSGTSHWSTRLDGIAAYGTPAIGDINGDGSMEIVAEFGANAEELRAFMANGQELWRAAVPPRSVLTGGSRDALALADLEGDGSVEIIRGRDIVNANGQLRCSGTGDGGGTQNYGYVPVIADIDLDGLQEIIAGRSVYDANCTIKMQLNAAADGYSAVGNFDADDQAEIVLVSNGSFSATGRLYLFDDNGSVIFGPLPFLGGGALGPPSLANVDDDLYPEIGIAGRTSYVLFDHDGSVRWSQDIQDESSNQTGSTSFDFEGDGKAEIVYADELNLRVFDGATGAVRMILPNTSGTTLEYPVVVDADSDGSADILIGANGSNKGIRKISSATRSWAPTRPIWNQHAYHIDNINDDGSIPRQPVKSWLTHNTFRLNTFPDRHPLGQPDLALFDLRLDESNGTAVHVLVSNRGLAPTAAATQLQHF